jgi:hypothetical protein
MNMKLHNPKRLLTLFSLAALSLGLSLGLNAQTLTHRYSFNDPAGSQTFADSVGGTNWDGTLVDDGAGTAFLDGTNLDLDGQGDFGQLPAGIMANYDQITVEVWADFSTNNPVWTRVFAFGSQNGGGNKNSGIDYCHYAGGNYQNLDVLSDSGGDSYANSTPGLNGAVNAHVTVVVDPVNGNMYYYNGLSVVSTQHGAPSPLYEINDAFDVIGRSLYDGDPTLDAAIHEFRVYQGVLSPQSVALNDAAGPQYYLASPGSIVSLNFSSPANPLEVNQIAPQNVTGNFTSVTNLNLVAYGGVVYASGNTNVLTISASGVVHAIAAGTTTITATYGSVTATNTLTVISIPATLVHRYSFTMDATDSVGGANGILISNATVSGGQLILPGGPHGSGYVSLPGGIINISTNASVTFEAWTSIGATAEWSHLFEFGAATVNNVYCAPRADAGGFHEFGLSEGGGVIDGQTLSWAHGWNNITLHYTGVIDPGTSTLAVYTNGVLMQAIYNASGPLSSIATNLATIGYSSYGDPDATLTMDEFRIYSGALTPAQIAMSDLSGPDSVNFDPGALASITVAATDYPAFSSFIAPVVWATYANLTNFNLLPNAMASEPGLVVTSSDTNIISVNMQNMLTTYRPGTVTLSASYLGKTSSAVVRVKNQAVLTHRYSFTNDDSDSVGGANGTNEGTAYNDSTNGVILDGGGDDSSYVSLPGGLLSTYRSATMDVWATISVGQQPWSRLWEFADVGPANANELYFAPAWNNPTTVAFCSFDPPDGGFNLSSTPPPLVNQTVHLTFVLGDGSVDIYTNAALYMTDTGFIAPASQAGIVGSWIGYSPYGDASIDGSVLEYRIYQGRLSSEEIKASDVLGPNVVLSATNAKLSASASGGNIILSWPVANAGFAVETRTSLNPGSSWTTLTNAPTLEENQWQLTVPNSGVDQFFRLVR